MEEGRRRRRSSRTPIGLLVDISPLSPKAVLKIKSS